MTTETERRRFLKLMGLAGAQLACTTLGFGLPDREAYAGPPCDKNWGVIPGHPKEKKYKILEIFLDRGASQWETFWLPGTELKPDFREFGMKEIRNGTPHGLPLSKVDWKDNISLSPCYPTHLPKSSTDAKYFEQASDGSHIHWGAPATPLYMRNDIFKRCRMITQYHKLAPHEAAIPNALAGHTLGDPQRAGTGTAIQRRFCHTNRGKGKPLSFILHSHSQYTADAAATTGIHPSAHRPIVIQVQDNNDFYHTLARNAIGTQSDALLQALRHEYREQLFFQGGGHRARSGGFDSYWAAAEQLIHAESLQKLFPNNLLVIDRNVKTCAKLGNATFNNRPSTKTMLHAAASLLTQGASRYVCVIDPGRAGMYDTHEGGGPTDNIHLLHTSAGLYNVLYHLADIIKGPKNSRGTLSLDDTMVVVNTEFGRTPSLNASFGRDHWPFGYTTLLIGGPIKRRSILGAIDSSGKDEGKTNKNYRYSPTDIRAAVLLAAGVEPFAPGNFRDRDFSNTLTAGTGKSREQIKKRLKEKILGL